MKKSTWLTIPNFLSAYRLLSFPFLLYLCATGNEKWFANLLIINLITDVLDGFIARAFNQQTEIGARLDSIADIGSYILAVLGIFLFKWEVISPHFGFFSIFLGLYLSTLVFSLIKFGRFTSFHLYSSKIGGYLQGIFFLLLFAGYFHQVYFYLAMGWGILSFLEHLTIQIMLPALRSNLKGLYWVLKSKTI
jgi:CDP-diacylglycerol--glycerol-3-phosphate 3-phosphatidyltransferase